MGRGARAWGANSTVSYRQVVVAGGGRGDRARGMSSHNTPFRHLSVPMYTKSYEGGGGTERKGSVVLSQARATRL